MLIIGIDCATDPCNVGLALAEYNWGTLSVIAVSIGNRMHPPATIVEGWLRIEGRSALLAIDAPLGWPAAMGRTLSCHSAGMAIEVDSNEFFRRETDRQLKGSHGKTPLDVGADRIARTAHAGLQLLDDLRKRLDIPIPLAWDQPRSGVYAIEVYPAATLLGHGFRAEGYKIKGGAKAQAMELARREILASLDALLDIKVDRDLICTNADALDAVVCTLAAKDFLEGLAIPPQQLALAKGEGWIWAKRPEPRIPGSSKHRSAASTPDKATQ